jgi:predicted Zn-dependent peptidase
MPGGNLASRAITRISQLSNGIRVATIGENAHFAAVGAFINAGSRHETPSHLGVAHFLSGLAFKVVFFLKFAV